MSDDCTDCNETERMDKKNWSKLDQRKKEACFAKSWVVSNGERCF